MLEWPWDDVGMMLGCWELHGTAVIFGIWKLLMLWRPRKSRNLRPWLEKNSVRHVSLSSLEPTAADRLTHALMHFNICSHHQMLCFLFSYGYIIYGSALIIFKTITKENHLVVPGCSRLFPLLLALLTSGSRRSPGVWWAPSRICSTCSGTPGGTRLGWSHTLWRTEECTE